MKVFAKIFGWASIAGALLLFPAASNAEVLGAMRVRLILGDVQVKIADTGEWAPASVNMPLVEGDELWVPEESRAAIQTSNGAHVRLDEHTALQVLRTDRDSFQFYLSQGSAYALNSSLRRSVLQIDTPDGSIRAFGRATFRIDVPEEGTDVSVFRGSVIAENASGTTRVRAGDMLVMGADGYAELSPVPPPDEWQHWNAQRDRIALARGEGYRHLPDELRVYSSDFEENGRWVSVPEYGYVWTPTVHVVADWAPYRHGRWIWRGGDYVWIGYEPWGWAPYHYGRWAFVVRIGWCWVPPARGDVYWAPGYVGWVRTGDHVAWVPLAPRETYYGHGHFGRHSVNITNVNINQVHVTNVYRNVNVTNAVTVVNQNTFITGRPAPVQQNVVVNIRENFRQRRDIVVGSPPIKPEKATFAPAVRSIPEAKHPPASVRKIDVRELKQSRPLVTESNRSAIRPEAQQRSLEVRKVEKPKAFREKVKERQQVQPVERRGPSPAERDRPQEAAPPEKGKQQVAPAERGRPQEAPPERGRLRETPAERGRPQEATTPEKGKRQVAPAEKGKKKATEPEKEKPKEGTPDNVSPENSGGGPDREGGKGRR